MRPEEKGSASPLVVRNALFTLAQLESTSVLRAGEGFWEGSSLASVTALDLCRLLGPIASRIYCNLRVAICLCLTTRSAVSRKWLPEGEDRAALC